MAARAAVRLAVYTFGIFRKPSAHPDNDGFHERNDAIFAVIANAQGFVAHSGYDGDPGPESWGGHAYPTFYEERGDGHSPSTLSLWEDLESIIAFTYSGLHGEAMRHARDWFDKPAWPPHAVWWVDGAARPNWSDAVARHAYLHEHGPTPYAFSLKHCFDQSGEPYAIDRARIRQLTQRAGS